MCYPHQQRYERIRRYEIKGTLRSVAGQHNGPRCAADLPCCEPLDDGSTFDIADIETSDVLVKYV